jgi:hypothetical protein
MEVLGIPIPWFAISTGPTCGQCSDLLYEVHRSHRWKVHRNHLGIVYPGTLFHRRQRGIPMHSYENRSEMRALPVSPPLQPYSRQTPRPEGILKA